MPRFTLSLVVFVSGAVVMAFEIVGSRVLAPVFGSSTIIWTALIGVILGALSLGYWLGGRAADNAPGAHRLARILVLAGLLIAAMAWLKTDVLRFAAALPGLRLGTTFASVVLFAPASVLLGMVSPYAVRLAMRDVAHSGSTVGNLYAFSTLGSIVGTFLAGFWLLPVAGHTSLLYLLAAVEASLGLLLVRRRAAAPVLLLAASILSAAFAARADTTFADGDGVDVDTEYSRVRVFEDTDWYTGRPVLRMNINDGYSSAMFLDTACTEQAQPCRSDPTDLVYPYTRFYRLGDHFIPGVRRALMIGGAAYSYPKDFLAAHPDGEIDVVEIDPGVTSLAERHFDLSTNNPRLRIFHEDGRTFLNPEHAVYDAIYVDVFYSNAVPYQLASREAVQRMRDLLAEGGVVIANSISPINGEDGRFFRALYATYRDVFPRVEIFHVPDQYDPKLVGNVILVAFRDERKQDFTSDDPAMAAMLDNLWRQPVADDTPILTDEKNPADFYASAYLGRLNRKVEE